MDDLLHTIDLCAVVSWCMSTSVRQRRMLSTKAVDRQHDEQQAEEGVTAQRGHRQPGHDVQHARRARRRQVCTNRGLGIKDDGSASGNVLIGSILIVQHTSVCTLLLR